MSALLIIHIRLFFASLSLSLCLSPSNQTLLAYRHSLSQSHDHASNYRLKAERLWFSLNWWKSTSPPPLHPSFSVSVPPLPGWRFTPARPRKDGSQSLRTSARRSELVKAAACNSMPPLSLASLPHLIDLEEEQRVSVETL